MITIDLESRFYSAFGYIANYAVIKNSMRTFNVTARDHCFADLALESCETGETFRFENSFLNDEDFANILAPTPMLSFKRNKNIIATDIDGSDFQVVESFGLKPYEITIEGILIDVENHWYPTDKVQQFRKLFEENAMLKACNNQVMYDLGITNLYIRSIEEIKLVDGYQDTVKFKMTANSIKPIEFFLND